MIQILLYVDGASRGNPGRAAIGVSIVDENGNEIQSIAEAIGHATNNEAEYRAAIRGMERALLFHPDKLQIRTDSELLARQLKGSYRVRAQNLKPLWAQAQRAMKEFKRVDIVIIPRLLNERADTLANRALDENTLPPFPLQTEGEGRAVVKKLK